MGDLHLQLSLPVLMLANIDPSWPAAEIQESSDTVDQLKRALQEAGHQVTRLIVRNDCLPQLLKAYRPEEWIVFNWCEEIPGLPRSGALVAQELDRAGFTYTGSDSITLAFSQDKRQVKRQLQEAGIPTPTWQVFTTQSTDGWERFPAIVKPAFEHCSYGIARESVVQSVQELQKRVRFVQEELQQPAVVEDFIDGPEFHVGVFGNEDLHVLPPAEIDYDNLNDIHERLCTFEANFDKDSRAYRSTIPKLPAALSSRQILSLEKIVRAAYHATSCRDYARFDLRLRDGKFFVLDVNPNADISPDTSLVKSAELVGYSYGQFGSLLVHLAAKRHPSHRLFFTEKEDKETGSITCLEL
jgi:D-alanine-D-alanine ligase